MAVKNTTSKKVTSKKATSKKSAVGKCDEVLVCTTAHLSKMYGVSERQIYNQTDNGIAVKIGANKYDCVKSVSNYIKKMRDQEKLRNQTPEQIKAETEAVKLEHEKLKARKTELQVLELEGKLHYEEDVKALWNDIIVAAKSKLSSIGVKLALQLKGETDEGVIQDLIDREVYDALKELSEYNSSDFEAEMLGRIEDGDADEEADNEDD